MENLISLVTTFGIGGIVGYWVKYHFDQLAENKRKIRKSKERQYKDLLSNLLAFFTGWENKEHKKQFMREVYTSAPVYASDEVIKLAHKFIQSHTIKKKDLKESDKIYAELVLAIRRELNKIQGQPDTQLSMDDIKILKLDE